MNRNYNSDIFAQLEQRGQKIHCDLQKQKKKIVTMKILGASENNKFMNKDK